MPAQSERHGRAASEVDDATNPMLQAQVANTGIVVAVVVTYHPDAMLAERLRVLRAQVERLLVVDNGSREADRVLNVALACDCDVMMNQENLGIAAALNQGLQFARQHRAEWLATFDQDSTVPTGAIRDLLAGLQLWAQPMPARRDLAILAMSHRDRGTGRDYHRSGEILAQSGRHRQLRTTITSGSLIRLELANLVGEFDATLFIDMVDLDYCLRCRRAGYCIVEDRGIVLDHAIGDSRTLSILGWHGTLTWHNAVRRYYITRNQLELVRRYAVFDPRWAAGLLWNLVSASGATLLFESERRDKTTAMLRGVFDFLFRRFGRRT